MARAHDQKSETPAAASGAAPARTGVVFDPLSDVLRTVKLQAALFFVIDASSPWCVSVPSARAFAHIILPGTRHVVSYHIAVEGHGIAAVDGADPVAFDAGDILVIPHGAPYRMASAERVPPELDHAQTLQFFRDLAGGRLPFVISEGGGGSPTAKFICGFLGCSVTVYNPVFAALPPLLHVRRREDGRSDLLGRLIDLAMAEARTDRPGARRVQLGLSELMFVEVLRRHLETTVAGAPGWLAGLRDPISARALSLLHAEPGRGWSLASLAREAGVSRSVLAARFANCVGEPPMRYLSLWRIQLAARLLCEAATTVSATAERVGFRSEAAFSRAFKKVTGQSPAAWRDSHADTAEAAVA